MTATELATASVPVEWVSPPDSSGIEVMDTAGQRVAGGTVDEETMAMEVGIWPSEGNTLWVN